MTPEPIQTAARETVMHGGILLFIAAAGIITAAKITMKLPEAAYTEATRLKKLVRSLLIAPIKTGAD